MPLAFFGQKTGNSLGKCQVSQLGRLAQGLRGCMEQPVGEGVGQVIDNFIGRFARGQHAPRLLHGLLPYPVRLLTQRTNGRARVLRARVGEKTRHLFVDEQARTACGHFALLHVLVHQLLQVIDGEKIDIFQVGDVRIDIALAKGLEVVIMQPGAIMGAYDIGTWSRLFVMVRDDKLPGVPSTLLTFTHVREVVAAHIAAAHKGQNGGAYLLGGENRTMMELVKEIAALVGKPAPEKETSMALLRSVAVLGDLASRFTGKEPAITPEMASLMNRRVSTTSAKAHRELGYRITPLKVMVKDCYDWMAAEGRI